MTPKNLTMSLIKWLKFGGGNPFERTLRKQFIGYVYVTLSALTFILIAMNFFFTSHDTISSLMEDSIMFFGFLQIGAKHFTAIQKAEIIANMLESSWYEFWSVDLFNEKFKKKAVTLYSRAKYLGDMYGVLVMCAGSLFIFQAGIKQEKTLVMEIWIPHKEILKTTPYYQIMYVFQGTFMLSAVWFSVIQLDKMFILLTCFVCVQQKMIQAKLDEIKCTNSPQENFKIVRSCVAHQNLLFRFLQNFEVVFSRLFLPTVGTNFLMTSFTMYGIIMEESINRKLTSAFVYVSVMVQFFAYCFAGHLIQEEGLNIGEAAYNSDWYNLEDNKVKMALMLVNLRSQRKIELTVGGLMILSLENFASVVRASFTFLTFIANART